MPGAASSASSRTRTTPCPSPTGPGRGGADLLIASQQVTGSRAHRADPETPTISDDWAELGSRAHAGVRPPTAADCRSGPAD